ncbi:unnamed protein product [Strongylus vulgaris]|uniref:Uncharacterized protein n=1 Tax=Strongylus vulgaris TaxID=40348 RepID=A0A3P7JMX9_STRVU|nr:unnamed protein product [Strongylus vulgaris]
MLQSFFPLALTFVPSSSIIIMSFFGENIGANGNIVALPLTLYPVIDPIVVLYFVSRANGNIVALLLTLYPVIDPIVVLYFVSSYREAIRMLDFEICPILQMFH